VTAKADSPETQIYVGCMVNLRDRLDCIESLIPEAAKTDPHAMYFAELIFLQFRKCLEQIALGSLTANKTRYAEANAKFREHWKARAILEAVEKIHPDFYPKPVQLLSKSRQASGRNRLHYDVIKDGALTRADFIKLYDATAEVLHVRNPFSTKDPVISIGYSVQDWVARIRKLVQLHALILVTGQCWLVEVPPMGKVFVHTASPDPNVR
jgi:hypothetical protein